MATPTSHSEHPAERDALVVLYAATDGANWKSRRNWLTDVPVGRWPGVTTDERGHVTHLHLNDNRLRGEIPPELGDLTSLQELYLSQNQLTGGIPPALGNLADLKHLVLFQNKLTGAIPPELADLKNLERLVLYDNRLSGEIPPALGSLAHLKRLYLGRNRFSGSIPNALRQVPENDLDKLGLLLSAASTCDNPNP
ncbi:MAG: leucine-rich repeat domain-containing protein [Chloroflexota bacterium]|nr:leucine-rich repeat domain-containing protein [Chloroflexota bacterium]MDE2840430.1 leucine-rich repeat domain-containing protein [Chloroflexota bacterium]MDE2931693.1 leucine-rich repeat domain-containing protein [Chloroflexota bacterium]